MLLNWIEWTVFLVQFNSLWICALLRTKPHASTQGKKSLHLQTAYWQLLDLRQNINCVFTCWKYKTVNGIVIIIIYNIIIIVVVAAKTVSIGRMVWSAVQSPNNYRSSIKHSAVVIPLSGLLLSSLSDDHGGWCRWWWRSCGAGGRAQGSDHGGEIPHIHGDLGGLFAVYGVLRALQGPQGAAMSAHLLRGMSEQLER